MFILVVVYRIDSMSLLVTINMELKFIETQHLFQSKTEAMNS